MALFLQESVQEEGIYFSIEEAYEGLIEAAMDMQDLTEGLLQADFIIHEECKVLTEAEGENKKVNFLMKALQRIKDFIKKMGTTIKNFVIKIAQFVKSSWDKLLSKLGVTKEVNVPVGLSALAQSTMSALTNGEKLVNNKDTSKAALDESKSKIKQLLNKFSVLSKDKKSKTEKVSVSRFSPILKWLSAGIVTAGVVNSVTLRSNELAGLEKELETYKRAAADTRISDQIKSHYESSMEKISKQINDINSKGKHSILLTKDIGFFARVLMVSIIDVVTLKQTVAKTNKRGNVDSIQKSVGSFKKLQKKQDTDRAYREQEKRERESNS